MIKIKNLRQFLNVELVTSSDLEHTVLVIGVLSDFGQAKVITAIEHKVFKFVAQTYGNRQVNCLYIRDFNPAKRNVSLLQNEM